MTVKNPMFMGPKVQKNFRLDPALAKSLRRFSFERERTETDVVEAALAAYMTKKDREDLRKAVQKAERSEKRKS